MVSPVVVKLTLADLGHAGHVVGRIYAWSTLGSIAGTFLTGFALIPWVGTEAVIFGVGVVLIAPRGGDRRVLPPGGLAADGGRRGGRPPAREPRADPPRRRPRHVVPPGDELLLHPGDLRAGGGRPRVPGPVAGPADPQLQLDRGPDAAPLPLPPDVRRAHGVRRRAVAAPPGALHGRRRLHAAALHGGDLPGRGPRGRRDRSRRHRDGDRDAGAERRHAGGHLQPGRPRGRGGEAGDRRPTISCSATPSTTTRSRIT